MAYERYLFSYEPLAGVQLASARRIGESEKESDNLDTALSEWVLNYKHFQDMLLKK
jgi:hypothetical protein